MKKKIKLLEENLSRVLEELGLNNPDRFVEKKEGIVAWVMPDYRKGYCIVGIITKERDINKAAKMYNLPRKVAGIKIIYRNAAEISSSFLM